MLTVQPSPFRTGTTMWIVELLRQNWSLSVIDRAFRKGVIEFVYRANKLCVRFL